MAKYLKYLESPPAKDQVKHEDGADLIDFVGADQRRQYCLWETSTCRVRHKMLSARA